MRPALTSLNPRALRLLFTTAAAWGLRRGIGLRFAR